MNSDDYHVKCMFTEKDCKRIYRNICSREMKIWKFAFFPTLYTMAKLFFEKLFMDFKKIVLLDKSHNKLPSKKDLLGELSVSPVSRADGVQVRREIWAHRSIIVPQVCSLESAHGCENYLEWARLIYIFICTCISIITQSFL